MILALTVTSSATLAGLVGLVTLAASMLVRLPAGVLVDRGPLRQVLVGADLLRALATAALVVSLMTGNLALWQLLVVAAVAAVASATSEVGDSVAIRHLVPGPHLPRAFALVDGRQHAVALTGQPAAGLLYGVAGALPLIADTLCAIAGAVLTAAIRHPMRDPSPARAARPRGWHDLLSGLGFLRREPLLRVTLLAAACYQLVMTAGVFALVAHLTVAGQTAARIGAMFALAAVGGLVGTAVAPAIQSRLPLRTVVLVMGWTATTVFGALAWVDRPLVAGALLGGIYLISTLANAILLVAQVHRTPARLQGRVMAASYFVAGLFAPLGPPVGGALLDAAGQHPTFVVVAIATGLVTTALHLSRALRATAESGP